MTSEAEDKELIEILGNASAEEKIPLVDYITNNGKGRISLSTESLTKLVSTKAAGQFSSSIDTLIIKEIKLFGGNSLVNLLRFGKGVSYQDVVYDVASKLGAKTSSSDSCETMEKAILSKVIEKAWDKMSPEERAQLGKSMHIPAKGGVTLAAILAAAELGGFGTYQLALLVANTIARQILGRGLALGANAALMESMGVLIGPIGWALTALWIAVGLAGPAYRVTVPCVIHIAYLRQKNAMSKHKVCPEGHVQTDPDAKFCSTCGAPIGAPRLRNS